MQVEAEEETKASPTTNTTTTRALKAVLSIRSRLLAWAQPSCVFVVRKGQRKRRNLACEDTALANYIPESRHDEVRRTPRPVEKLPRYPLSLQIRYQNSPILRHFEPESWSLPAQYRLFQHAGPFYSLGRIPPRREGQEGGPGTPSTMAYVERGASSSDGLGGRPVRHHAHRIARYLDLEPGGVVEFVALYEPIGFIRRCLQPVAPRGQVRYVYVLTDCA
jgi:hypothetical protein